MRNPFLRADIAARYENWYTGQGRRQGRLERRLIRKLLDRMPDARTVLEVGAGTGHFTRFFAECGLEPVGVDVSRPMLADARQRGPQRYVQGDAGTLPFRDRSFDLVATITALEFVPDARLALREAVRVARRGLLLGVLNRHSVLGQIRVRRGGDVFGSAQFYTPRELGTLVSETAGARLQHCYWRTTIGPIPGLPDSALPWGAFVGLIALFEP